MHNIMKSNMPNPKRSDFLVMTDCFARYTAHQMEQIKFAEGEDIIKTVKKLRKPAFSVVNHCVSKYALQMVYYKVIAAEESIKKNTQRKACVQECSGQCRVCHVTMSVRRNWWSDVTADCTRRTSLSNGI